MIQGHGDDRWRFDRPIRANFSSNVYGRVDLGALKAHLATRLDAIGHYPEPEPYSLERALASRLGLDPAAVCVTNGATEAIYLTAHAFAGSHSTILQPTFSEYADASRLYSHSVAHSAALDFVLAGRKNAVQPENHPQLHSLDASERSDGAFSDSLVAGRPGGAGTVRKGEMPRALTVLPARETETSESETGGAERAMRCPVKPGMTIGDKPKMPDEGRTGIVWLCNPNNPTGSVIPKEQLVEAIEGRPETVFVIDQSYGFFTREPLLTASEAVRLGNVIQLHSMTKRYAMPGLRLGYVVGHPQLIDRLRAVRMPWSVNGLAIEAGLYLCEHPDTGPIDLPSLLAETQRLRAALDALPGLSALPTQTHFFLCRLAQGRAADLKQWLADNHGLLIRNASNFEGLGAGCFRIATQTPEENELLIAAIRLYLEEAAR